MPLLEIATNIPRAKVTPQVLSDLSKALAATIGKPEQYCSVHVIPDQLILFGGSDAPCGQARLMSIGRLGVEENKAHSAKVFEFVKQHLGISEDRMYLTFIDKPASEVGYKGTTFHQILGL